MGDAMEFPLTTGPVARAAKVSEQIIRLYADQGLLPCTRTPAGVRIFAPDAPQKARQIFEGRMRQRGRMAG